MNKSQNLFWWIATRTLFAHHKGKSFGFVSVISILGLSVGVAALTVTLGILTGFDKAYKEILLGFGAHAVVLADGGVENPYEKIKTFSKMKDLRGMSPFVLKEAMVSFKGKVKGAILKGVDYEKLPEVTDLASHLEPRMDLATMKDPSASESVIIGKTLAQDLNIKVGEVLNVIVLKENTRPQWLPLRVKSLFYSGMHEFDSHFIYLNLKLAQSIFYPNNFVTGIEFTVHEPEKIEAVALKIEQLLSYPLYLIQWKDLNANLFAALKLERVVFFLVILPIVLVGALTVIAALIMFIQEKQKGMAILRAMGMKRKTIFWIVSLQGTMIGILGILTGFLLGTIINLILYNFPLFKLSPQVYFIDHLPISFQLQDYLLVGGASLILCILATLLPALKATHLQPVEGIRGY